MRCRSLAPLYAACLSLALVSCNTTASTTPSALQQAADTKSLTPEQKYAIACNSADALMLAYRAFAAPKQSASVNARVEASYAAIQTVCVNRPENYATALLTVLQAANAFKASLPKAA